MTLWAGLEEAFKAHPQQQVRARGLKGPICRPAYARGSCGKRWDRMMVSTN